jgi:hypothetical protein
MTLSVAGGTHDDAKILLSPDWYKQLNLKQLSAYVRHAYVWRQYGSTSFDSSAQFKHVNRWDGGTDAFGCKFTPVWPRIAKMITTVGADPGIWVASHFSTVAQKKQTTTNASFEVRDVAPSQLCGKNSQNIYEAYCAITPQIIQQEYETAGRSINLRLKSLSRIGLSKADQYACAICDDGYVTAAPFFRHGFATLFDAKDAAAKYLPAAALEYEAQQRLYANVPDWCITDKLLDTVNTIRAHWRRLAHDV